ncbi:hypothetical protein ACFL1Z_01735 [Thermodesulfobacteriota bacterium]
MIKKRILDSNRIRRIKGGFGFIPHRFLTDGFLDSLSNKELLLYFFLILASDRYGLSFYAYDANTESLPSPLSPGLRKWNNNIWESHENWKLDEL